MNKIFQLEITKEGYGGTDQPNEVFSEIIFENNNIKIMKENFERLKTAVKIGQLFEDTRYPEKLIGLDIPTFVKVGKYEFRNDTTVVSIFLKDDKEKEIEVGMYGCFNGRSYGSSIICAQVISDMKVEF